jgi:hypothetical protein
MRLTMAFVFVLTTSVIGQVEHAPTIAQCQADQRYWASVLEGDSYKLPEYDVLRQWDHEMTVCEKVDPDNKWTYYNTGGEIDSVEMIRMVKFLTRHGLWKKFKEEDADGKR